MIAAGNISKDSVDSYREQIDSLSYGIKKIFCEDCHADGVVNKPAEFAEMAIKTIDQIAKLNTLLTHTEIKDNDLPKVNSIISSYRWIAHELRSVVPNLEGHIAGEYLNMYNGRIEDLEECAGDLDITYFQLRDDSEFNDLISELDGI